MKRFLAAIFIMMSLSTGTGIAQDTTIDNYVWQIVEEGDFRFRVPSTWENVDEIWHNPDGIGILSFAIIENADATDIFSDAIIDSEEVIRLPIADAQRVTTSADDTHTIGYIVPLAEQTIALVATYSSDLPEDAQSNFTTIIEQVANTLISTQPNSNSWSLYANSEATIFLRMPANWTRQTSDANTLTVSETFDDVSLTVTYRDLGRPFELAEIETQFVTIYNTNDYDIQAQETINLPIGDALFFRLGDVAVTTESTHTQLQYVVARENYMLVIVAGADERYFEEYEMILKQIIDTMQFEAP